MDNALQCPSPHPQVAGRDDLCDYSLFIFLWSVASDQSGILTQLHISRLDNLQITIIHGI